MVQRLFNTLDVVSLIMPLLDDLSLIRCQRINRTFYDELERSSVLQRRLLFRSAHQGEVLDVTNTAYMTFLIQTNDKSTLEKTPGPHLSPFLDWFTLSGVLRDTPHSRPGLEVEYASFVLLPHALLAAESSASTIHTIHLTSPPVDRVKLRLEVDRTRYCEETRTIIGDDPGGVTIGAVLREWARVSSSETMGYPVILYIPWGEALPESDRRRERFAAYFHYNQMFRVRRHFNRDVFAIDMQWPKPDGTWQAAHSLLLTKWYRVTTWSAGKTWFAISRDAQRRFVLEFLRDMRHTPSMIQLIEYVHCPMWPALDVPFEVEDEEASDVEEQRWLGFGDFRSHPYRSEFAGGIVLNSKKIPDLFRIWPSYDYEGWWSIWDAFAAS